jgi:hypothetical protein
MPNVPSPRNSRTDPNFGRNSGNPSPRYDHLHNHSDQPRGVGRGFTSASRDLLHLAVSQGAIPDMSANPDLDFLAEVRDNTNLRYDLRLTAASARLPYVARRLASEPFVPPVPDQYQLPRLDTTAACQEALAIVTGDMVSGKLRLDTGKYFLANIQTAMESHKITEVEAQIAEFRAIVEQVEAAKTIEHMPHPTEEPSV